MAELEAVVIRDWRGQWEGSRECAPDFQREPGGYVLTFHMGTNDAHKVEHYATVQEIIDKYPQYCWLKPSPEDTPDVVLVGI